MKTSFGLSSHHYGYCVCVFETVDERTNLVSSVFPGNPDYEAFLQIAKTAALNSMKTYTQNAITSLRRIYSQNREHHHIEREDESNLYDAFSILERCLNNPQIIELLDKEYR